MAVLRWIGENQTRSIELDYLLGGPVSCFVKERYPQSPSYEAICMSRV